MPDASLPTRLHRTASNRIAMVGDALRRGMRHTAVRLYRSAERCIDAADVARGLEPGPCVLDSRVELEHLIDQGAVLRRSVG